MRNILYILIILSLFSCGAEKVMDIGIESDLLTYPDGETMDSVAVIPPDTVQFMKVENDSITTISDYLEKRYPIKYFVVHCTATGVSAKPENIVRYWEQNLGWSNPGYHFMILRDGSLYMLKRINFNPYLLSNEFVNGVKGMNRYSIHVSYIGGLYKDDRTEEQKKTLDMLVNIARNNIPDIQIVGHRDIQIHTKKACPNFDVRSEYGSSYETSDVYKGVKTDPILIRVNQLNN